jgi:acyl dehydratase
VGQRARRTPTSPGARASAGWWRRAPTYLGDTLTAEIEVLALKPVKPVCQLRATITNQDGTVLLEGECWTYTLRPA